MRIFIVALFSLVFCGSAAADVKLVVKDFSGKSSTIYSNGQRSRIESGQMPGYAIVDHVSGEFLVVDSNRKEIISLKLADKAATGGTQLGVSLKDKGGGQKIAGYLTRKYQVDVNGENCGTVYASKQLLENSELRGMFETMRGFQEIARGMTAGMSSMLSVCQRANLELTDAMASSGAPMRMLDAGGKLISEVVSVDSDHSVAAGNYAVPAGMKVVSMDEKMNQATQQMQNMPDMNELMQQLQKSGGEISPEMQQQMEQMKNMLQQLQQ